MSKTLAEIEYSRDYYKLYQTTFEMPDVEPITTNDEDFSYKWVKITDQFFLATSELELGELLHDSDFGLFEAMSAIEMMDPKMDAGMMCNLGNKKVLNFEQAVQTGKLKLDGLTISEQIGIIDATLACLVTWLEGHSLAQTVFTNLYLHNFAIIDDRCIKAFSICILKICDLIREIVNKGGAFEEEDFQPMTYGFKMANDITDSKATSILKEVEEDLQRKVKNTRIKQGEERDQEKELEHEEAQALYSRIKFVRLFFQVLMAFHKREVCGIEVTVRQLIQCEELLPIVLKTISKGIQPEPQTETNNWIDYPTVMGFEPLVNQRLLPPTFPRYTKIKSREEAIEYLLGLSTRLKSLCNIVSLNSFHSVLDFFLEFSKISPCVLSRSSLQLIYLPQNNRIFGAQPMVEVLRDAARNFICPPALAPKSTLLSNSQAKEFVDTFLNHAQRPFTVLIQISGHNRARQRDKLGHLLEDFAALQDEADKVDAYLHGLLIKSDTHRLHLACFGTWILYHTLRIMIMYVLAGFELELYSHHEFYYVFWYMYEFLYGWMVSALTRADSFLLEQETIQEQQQKGRNVKKNKKKKKSLPHGREIALNQGHQNLCGGYFKALMGFNLHGRIKKINVEFDSEQIRYEHRFAPFNNVITPPLVQYNQFKDMTDMSRFEIKPQPEDMYLAACKCFQQAKSLYECIQNPNDEITALIKVAKTNFVVMKLLAGGHKKESKDPPEFDFSINKNFPIIKIT